MLAVSDCDYQSCFLTWPLIRLCLNRSRCRKSILIRYVALILLPFIRYPRGCERGPSCSSSRMMQRYEPKRKNTLVIICWSLSLSNMDGTRTQFRYGPPACAQSTRPVHLGPCTLSASCCSSVTFDSSRNWDWLMRLIASAWTQEPMFRAPIPQRPCRVFRPFMMQLLSNWRWSIY